MNGARLKALLAKEWLEVRHNRTIIWTFLGLTAFFTVLPLALTFGLPLFLGPEAANDPDMAELGALLAKAYPDYARLSLVEQFQVFMLRQFVGLFLLVPVMGAISVATYSLIGEKTTRSPEALLAAPVTTTEVLLAKTLAAALPATLVTWAAALAFAALVALLAGPEVARVRSRRRPRSGNDDVSPRPARSTGTRRCGGREWNVRGLYGVGSGCS